MKKLFVCLVLGILLLSESVGAAEILEAAGGMTPSPMIPGTDGFLRLTVNSTGTSDISAVYVQLDSLELPLTIIDKDDLEMKFLGAIKTGGSSTLIYKFKVPPSASSGTYAAKFSIYKYVAGGREKAVTHYVLIPVQAPTTLTIESISPTSFRPGEKANMNITLSNRGNSRLTNLVLSWQVPNNVILPLGSDNKIVLNYLDANQETQIPFKVVVGSGIAPDVYPLSIVTTYYDQTGVQQTMNSTVGITVGGTTDFDVSLQQTSGSTTSLSIANIGVNPATAISVKIPVQEAFSVVGPSEVFLGNLDPGEYTVASFQLGSKQRGAEERERFATGDLKVEVTYTDTVGNRETVQEEVSISIGAGLEGNGIHPQGRPRESEGLQYVIIGVVGFVAILIIWKLRMRKRR